MKNKRHPLDAVFAPKAEPVREIRKSKGGIDDYSEVADSLRIRGEFLSATFDPKITLTSKTITLNTSCVKFFSHCQNVVISIDERHRRLFVEPVVDGDDNSVQWANSQIVRNVPRACAIKLCPKLFYMMGWNPEAKYRVEPKFHELDYEIMVFPLDNAVPVLPKALPVESGK